MSSCLRKALLAGLVAVAWSASCFAAEFSFGPWRLGMSRDQVRSFTEYGPYERVGVTGGLEIHDADIDGKKGTVSFVFDEHGLSYIQVWYYEGSGYELAKKAVLEVFDLFTQRFGGVEVPGVKVSGRADLSRQDMDALLTRVLGTAKELGQKTGKEQKAAMLLFFDLKPKRQPDGSRLHSQWGYHSQFDTFYVFLYQDRADAPERKIESNIQLEPL